MSSRQRSLRLASVLARVNKRKRAAKKLEAENAAQPRDKQVLRLVQPSAEEQDDSAPKRKR